MPSPDEEAHRKAVVEELRARERARHREQLPVTHEALDDLLTDLRRALAVEECDHSLRLTSQWAARHGLDISDLEPGLAEPGGYCDCEVGVDVHPGDLFDPPTRH